MVSDNQCIPYEPRTDVEMTVAIDEPQSCALADAVSNLDLVAFKPKSALVALLQRPEARSFDGMLKI